MSTLETILTRAMGDPGFAERLFNDLDLAVLEYNLSTGELEQLKTLSLSDMSTLPGLTPEERKSFLTFFAEPSKVEYPNIKI